MNVSYWEKKSFLGKNQVVIIGSGIVGLSAALEIKAQKPTFKVLVVDAGFLPEGASTKNAGFACIGSSGELLSDLKHQSEESVFNLVKRRQEGLALLRKTLGDKAINYEEFGGFELFDNETLFNECAHKIDYLNKELKSITKLETTFTLADNQISNFGFKGIQHIIKNNFEGQIDTGKMMRALIKKAQENDIYVLQNASVSELNESKNEVAITINNNYIINAEQVIVCTNGFAKKLLPNLDLRPARAQVVVTSPIPNFKVKGSFHYDEGFYYFRNIDDRILFGGGRNLDFEGETTTEFGKNEKILTRLNEMLQHIIIPETNYTIDATWSGIMAFGTTKEPIIKQVGNRVFCAVRLGGMGVAIGSLVGKEVAIMALSA